LPDVSHNPLPRPALGAMRFAQRPVGVSFAVLLPVTGAKKHGPIVGPSQGMPKAEVFTTTPSGDPRRHRRTKAQGVTYRIPTSVRPSNMTRITVPDGLLANFG
jgi:hypothetical protein